jgi:hypothetical protein
MYNEYENLPNVQMAASKYPRSASLWLQYCIKYLNFSVFDCIFDDNLISTKSKLYDFLVLPRIKTKLMTFEKEINILKENNKRLSRYHNHKISNPIQSDGPLYMVASFEKRFTPEELKKSSKYIEVKRDAEKMKDEMTKNLKYLKVSLFEKEKKLDELNTMFKSQSPILLSDVEIKQLGAFKIKKIRKALNEIARLCNEAIGFKTKNIVGSYDIRNKIGLLDRYYEIKLSGAEHDNSIFGVKTDPSTLFPLLPYVNLSYQAGPIYETKKVEKNADYLEALKQGMYVEVKEIDWGHALVKSDVSVLFHGKKISKDSVKSLTENESKLDSLIMALGPTLKTAPALNLSEIKPKYTDVEMHDQWVKVKDVRNRKAQADESNKKLFELQESENSFNLLAKEAEAESLKYDDEIRETREKLKKVSEPDVELIYQGVSKEEWEKTSIPNMIFPGSIYGSTVGIYNIGYHQTGSRKTKDLVKVKYPKGKFIGTDGKEYDEEDALRMSFEVYSKCNTKRIEHVKEEVKVFERRVRKLKLARDELKKKRDEMSTKAVAIKSIPRFFETYPAEMVETEKLWSEMNIDKERYLDAKKLLDNIGKNVSVEEIPEAKDRRGIVEIIDSISYTSKMNSLRMFCPSVYESVKDKVDADYGSLYMLVRMQGKSKTWSSDWRKYVFTKRKFRYLHFRAFSAAVLDSIGSQTKFRYSRYQKKKFIKVLSAREESYFPEALKIEIGGDSDEEDPFMQKHLRKSGKLSQIEEARIEYDKAKMIALDVFKPFEGDGFDESYVLRLNGKIKLYNAIARILVTYKRQPEKKLLVRKGIMTFIPLLE